MRAVLYRKYGGPEVLEVVQQHATPQRKPGEVMIKVYSTSCNPLDVKIRNGSIPIAVYNKVRRGIKLRLYNIERYLRPV